MITPCDYIINQYRKIVANKHPKLLQYWPVLSGYDVTSGSFNRHYVLIIKDTGNPDRFFNDIEKFDTKKIGALAIKDSNIEAIRKNLSESYKLTPRSYIVLLRKDNKNFDDEIEKMLSYHETIMGIRYRKIFLSNYGISEKIISEYKATLETMGFEPWVDENDLLGYGSPSNYSQGFTESCAAIFFITDDFSTSPEFKKEIEYAVEEKRKKNSSFSILTLILNDENKKCRIPMPLKHYLLKETNNITESILEIIKAIPVQISHYSYYNIA